MKENEKIAIGWIDNGQVQTGFIAYLMNIVLSRSEKIETVIAANGPYLSANRNTMARMFLETDCDWLLTLDSDILLSVESYDELIKNADSDKYDVLGGKYFLSFDDGIHVSAQDWHPDAPGEGKWLDLVRGLDFVGSNGVVDNLHSVGLGCALIHRRVLEKIVKHASNPMPWFQDYWRDYPYNSWISDDIHFYSQVHKYNFNVALCMSTTTTHLKQFAINDSVYLSFSNFNKYQNDEKYKLGKNKHWKITRNK